MAQGWKFFFCFGFLGGADQAVAGPIRPVQAASATAGASQDQKTLVQRLDSGDLHVRRHATWGMSEDFPQRES